MGTFDLKTVT